MDIILRPWRLYADFDGRSRRSEYFVFILVRYGVMFALVFFLGAFGAILQRASGQPVRAPIGGVAVTVVLIYFLATIVPGWSVTVRRLHDQGKSFKWIFLTFVPIFGVGLIASLVFGFWPGDDFENDYGPDPRQPEQVGATELGGVFS